MFFLVRLLSRGNTVRIRQISNVFSRPWPNVFSDGRTNKILAGARMGMGMGITTSGLAGVRGFRVHLNLLRPPGGVGPPLPRATACYVGGRPGFVVPIPSRRALERAGFPGRRSHHPARCRPTAAFRSPGHKGHWGVAQWRDVQPEGPRKISEMLGVKNPAAPPARPSRRAPFAPPPPSPPR